MPLRCFPLRKKVKIDYREQREENIHDITELIKREKGITRDSIQQVLRMHDGTFERCIRIVLERYQFITKEHQGPYKFKPIESITVSQEWESEL